MIPQRLHTGRRVGCSSRADLERLNDVAPVADRVAATWRRLLPRHEGTRASVITLAAKVHEAELARLFARGIRMGRVARALAERGVIVGGGPVSARAFAMAWLRIEKARAEARPLRMAA